jgi:hypothetical protein
MGRPLNNRFFGNRNVGSTSTTADNGIGGQGVASVTIAGEFSGFTLATTTVTFSAPQLPGGVTATGTATIVGGAVTAIVMTEQGSGYTAAPTVTIADSDVGAEVTTGTATAVLTTDSGALNSTNASTNQQNAIVAYAYVTGNNLIADIKKQVSGRRYKVTTTEGTLTCKLVTDGVANAVGEMTITATDANGNTYYVSKLTRHKATLVRLVDDGDDGDWVYATGAVAPWDFAAASGLVVQIANA